MKTNGINIDQGFLFHILTSTASPILFGVLNSSHGFWLSKESYESHKSDLSKDIERERERRQWEHNFFQMTENRSTNQSGMEVFQKTKKGSIGPSHPTSWYVANSIQCESSRSCLHTHVHGNYALDTQD